MHSWNDEWFKQYGKQLHDAENYIRHKTKLWSGCLLSSKEKYGTIRYEHLYPLWWRYAYRNVIIQYCYYKHKNLGRFVVRIVVKRACKKWPDIQEEILDDFDNGDYL